MSSILIDRFCLSLYFRVSTVLWPGTCWPKWYFWFWIKHVWPCSNVPCRGTECTWGEPRPLALGPGTLYTVKLFSTTNFYKFYNQPAWPINLIYFLIFNNYCKLASFEGYNFSIIKLKNSTNSHWSLKKYILYCAVDRKYTKFCS